eukprot:XP_011674099.1 PREDICTED: uncharacterized protein LOC105443011 [Strongylocentrotus purpuratus]
MGTTRKTPLDYTELLTTKVNKEFPKRLMVEGEGGAGKTTFCSKIAWDWANGTKEFEEFDWVLVVPFRNTKEGQTVGDIAKTYLSDSNTVQSHQIDKYILSAPLKVFIIFDGLDEYEGDILTESSDFAKIIRSEKFVECRVLYEEAISVVIQRPREFHDILYFTASQTKNVAIDVTKRLINTTRISIDEHIIVDIAFEAYDEDAAKLVGQQLFGKQKTLNIDDNMSAHTVSGYLFIMKEIQMETLILNRISYGPTVSRDLADVICSSTALTSLEFSGGMFHDDFYGTLEGKVKTSKVERFSLKLMNILDEHTSHNQFYKELASGACSVEGLFGFLAF